MKLLVIILFFAVPLILIIESFFQKLQNRSGSPNKNGIYQTIAALLILTAALFEKPIMDWLLTLFGGMLLPYLGIWTGYLAILLLIQDILSIEFLQKKVKLSRILIMIPVIAMGVYCFVNQTYLGKIFDDYLK